ncbi:ABC transporter ATP-binding protein [Roseibium algicola]|jgi:peptide/nickel transport system ATP-binding protein|uniref:ABC transporter ATP-binding protein n=1 Tax=Roseibium algicola TaxID=2857014 RepID=A0ABM6HXL8_9HYPH|nr:MULTISPECIES: ABC transporter ATP-binding protein [Stappiaceae]MCR9280169.1 ABC transporter ATP-binding protein [Paracoccaceae bacterium]MEC9421188.1 ABC transporter ATP-binding protein [Pseudomonadota bacterium]AMN54145.1 ABC transporter ATP-binding protein [Labrenzia sp. CP4]AQQ02630.1 ABC transporter ATP-binding protein [Roseibium aggregatum]ERP98751.1 ABC transporter ATP-binding protein [Labrenzia sp. C1B10]
MSFLSIQDLTVQLKNGMPLLRHVSLDVEPGEVRALVGESGAGKSMIGKAVLGILPKAARLTGGKILLDGEDLQTLSQKARRQRIGARAALIPQDPLTALNPSRRVGPQITDRLVDILGWKRPDAEKRALELLEEVHIQSPERVMKAYPHELSGGMRQRILIASAFAAEPKLIIADEPTTALDVTVQKQILKLIREMQQRHGTALLFVTHDLGVVSKIAQSLTVLYAGKVIEETSVENFFAAPSHAYSKALLAATPKYTDPQGSLTPVPEGVTKAVEAEVAAFDAQLKAGARP